MPIHRLLTAAAAVSLIAGAAMAQPPAAPAPAAAAPAAPSAKLVPNGDLITTLRASGQFNTFVKALDAVNLATLLKSSPGLTVFAPIDTAFPQSKLDTMLADKAGLQKTLLHYIINAKVDSAKIKGARGGVPTGAGDQIILDGTGTPLKADNANIIQADVITSNGIIHVIDAMLVPGSVPATLPEPAPEAAAAPPPPAPAPAAKAPPKKKK